MKFSIRRAQLMNGLSALAFFFALVMNGLANILPLNGLETGTISDRFANYFAPAGLTFSIWAVIYTVLALFVFWRLQHYQIKEDTPENRYRFRIDAAFMVSSILNGLWIIAWHFLWMYLSVGLMLFLLVSLLYINLQFRGDRSLPTIPFRLYFGWITVATVANITTMIVADASAFRWLWNGGEVSQVLITTAIILVTISIGNVTLIRLQDPYYAGVIIWALLGIYLRHTMNQPQFGIIGIANIALFGVGVTVMSLLWLFRKSIRHQLFKS